MNHHAQSIATLLKMPALERRIALDEIQNLRDKLISRLDEEQRGAFEACEAAAAALRRSLRGRRVV